jgi:hypothetical protein
MNEHDQEAARERRKLAKHIGEEHDAVWYPGPLERLQKQHDRLHEVLEQIKDQEL